MDTDLEVEGRREPESQGENSIIGLHGPLLRTPLHSSTCHDETVKADAFADGSLETLEDSQG